jgi:intracellular sulfur oxidation DsrE/DsrF family protein
MKLNAVASLRRFLIRLLPAAALALMTGCVTLDTPVATPAPAAPAPAPAAPAVAKVVWHVDFADPRRLSALIQNVNNMVTTYQSELMDYDVRIVFLAGGIRFVTEDPLKGTPFAEDKEYQARRPELIQRLQQLRELSNVKLELCEITREALQLPTDRIIPGVEPVRSGVVRIAELQSQGFAYLKVE